MELLERKLREAEALTTVAVFFLQERPRDLEAAIKDAIHEVAGILYGTASAEISLKEWLCSFQNNRHAIDTLDQIVAIKGSDFAELEEDVPCVDAAAVVGAVRNWMLAFVEKHGGYESVRNQIMEFQPTAGVSLLRQIPNKSLLTWALRRLSELLKQ